MSSLLTTYPSDDISVTLSRSFVLLQNKEKERCRRFYYSYKFLFGAIFLKRFLELSEKAVPYRSYACILYFIIIAVAAACKRVQQ